MVTVAGVISSVPSTYTMFLSLDVTSSPLAFTIISSSQFAVTVPSDTSLTLSFETAFDSVYPSGRFDTATDAPCDCPSYVKVPPVVVTVITALLSVTVSVPIFSAAIL